jgi:DNA-3-methyladenine glycosylase
MRRLPRSFFARDAQVVAPELLGKVLVGPDGRACRIVEAEAYAGMDDPASHAYRGITPRTTVMFGPPGHWYVYFTYGMHWCANAICGKNGQAAGVLLRAGEPLSGIDIMREVRPKGHEHLMLSGPAKLCQGMGITREEHGTDIVRGKWKIGDDGYAPEEIIQGPRVGIREGLEMPWRFGIKGHSSLSKPF